LTTRKKRNRRLEARGERGNHTNPKFKETARGTKGGEGGGRIQRSSFVGDDADHSGRRVKEEGGIVPYPRKEKTVGNAQPRRSQKVGSGRVRSVGGGGNETVGNRVGGADGFARW